jgi:hypothetical protein
VNANGTMDADSARCWADETWLQAALETSLAGEAT